MSESPTGVIADPGVAPEVVAEAPPAVTPPVELPPLKPDNEIRAQMGLPPAEEKPAERPTPSPQEQDEMKRLLEIAKQNQLDTPPIPDMAEQTAEPEKPADGASDKKANILSRVFGGIKAAVVGTVVFILAKLKALLNFGIDDPHAQGAG